MLKSPYIQANKEKIDWEFWDIHVGEADILHRQLVKQAINEIVEADPSTVQELAEGYQNAKHLWETFWGNMYSAARTPELVGVV
ncbi:hypothetical protein [Aphanothece sacrum]|uniref:Uncharacterized protein n=1 Tax=Aphanothece sacrum FPU1 TaxID=1920663 RepID=A0A401IKS2_APHSA|nr:hypothetical protein [Aphanothece sacrum]GBF81850.1 hypothetical protein AsFPU1_3271 [Aphanothece sacrum FPU1]GBF85669.1 hypothetical protein AsFPU3_2733 [Aphanothece sacrum FPU3]